jgi:hypothetical protein
VAASPRTPRKTSSQGLEVDQLEDSGVSLPKKTLFSAGDSGSNVTSGSAQ